MFNVILTQSDKILNTCSNVLYQPFGGTWFKPDQYNKEHKKEFKIAHLRGNLLKSYGHSMRHEILDRENRNAIKNKRIDRCVRQKVTHWAKAPLFIYC